ncbi:MAG: AAA family ATPase [Deltaproteobacteria bacterium]|jgi:chromosome segregation protein
MKIRRVEIQGFKSFADRTVLRFGEGITGVVGPNGCGKSNIVDAIRWVMGEQSAKHLRGSGMQDVIFAGSESRGPSGMSEVTISFKNDGNLVPPEYQRHDEISVTRRLFRDGTSEYAINKVQCRLRDIHDLFMGTGIGKNAYSIIEQGRIGLIVTSKPEDRRAIIEDAAGVSRYKARRKQAERRIQATEQNLLRITDITEELSGRLKTLERQAKRAEKYKRIKTELKELELHQATHRYLELQTLETFDRRQAKQLRAEIEEAEQAIAADEARLAEALEAFEQRDEVLRERETKISADQQALALAKNNAEFLDRERTKLLDRKAEAETETTELNAELERLQAERAEAKANRDALESSDGAELKSLDDREAALTNLNTKIGAAESALDADKQAMVDALTAIAEHKNNLANLERAGRDLEVQIGRSLTAKKSAAGKAREAEAKAKDLSKTLEDNRQLKLSLEDERSTQEALVAKLREEMTETEAQLQRAREELMDKRSRLKTLDDIQKNYEGCTDAVRRLMKQKERDPSLSTALHGLVADVVSAEPRFEAAVEAVLGDRLQYVIVNSQNDGLASIDFLKKNESGRSSFIPLDLREDHVSWAPWPSSRPPGASSQPPAEANGAAPGHDATNGATNGTSAVATDALAADGRPADPAVATDRPNGADAPAEAAAVDDAQATPAADHEAPTQGAVVTVPTAVEVPERFAARHGDPDRTMVPRGSAMHAATDVAAGPALPTPALTDLPYPENADSMYWWPEESELWPDMEAPGVCGKMVDLVRAQPGYEHVARVLMGDVVIVDGLNQAQNLWRSNGHRKTLVTLSGEVLDPVGVLTGGSSEGKSKGMLKQKREIKELTDDVRRLEAKATVAEERYTTLKQRVADLDKQIQTLSKQGHAEELSLVNLEQDLRRLQDELQRESDEKRSRGEEIEMLRKKRASVSDEAEKSTWAVEELEKARTAAEQRVTERAAEVTGLKQDLGKLSEDVTDLKVKVAANREKRDSSAKHLERVERRIGEVETRLVRLAEIVEECATELEGIAERITQAEQEGETLEASLAQDREEVRVAREALEGEQREVKAEAAQTREKRTAIDAMKEALSELTLKIREVQIGLENLVAQIDERYRIHLPEILTDYHLLPRMSAEHEKETAKLRRQLDNIGPINLTAIDEFKEVGERYEFLNGQKKDLEEAIASLKAAIKRINKTSKERYVEAFRLVNEKFQAVFPKLFNGGRCALVMTDESDPLESGIEMLAQPPGKKLQSVNLLSGGEKALTAVSLIFAIFLIKPTPFCLLDEVDAPLDEANVGRYNEMLREMSSISQFILITHNKRTMELPDRLYGVTMEEPGISKIVPVDIIQDRKLQAV